MSSNGVPQGLQPQDVVLTIFGAHVRRPGQRVWSGGMVQILEELGVTSASARASLARLVNRNLLARSRDGRRVFYSLTQRAEELLSEGDRRIFSFGRSEPAVALWTVLWHAIPEEQRGVRSQFASRLRFLGFGAVQDATWVAARNREDELRLLVSQLGIEAHVSIMVGHMSAAVPPVALIAEAWGLEDVRGHYEHFLAEYESLRSAAARRRLAPAQAFRKRTLMLHRFRGFPAMDPELPVQYDTLRELRERVVGCFDEVYRALEQPAGQYFWQLAEGDPAPALAVG